MFWNGRVWGKMVYQPSRLVTSLFTIFIMIKVNGLERKPFVKTGIFPFASIKTNTRKGENDYIWLFQFLLTTWQKSMRKSRPKRLGNNGYTLAPAIVMYFPCTINNLGYIYHDIPHPDERSVRIIFCWSVFNSSWKSYMGR